MGVKATVQNGRLIVNEEARLPEGTVLHLELEDDGDILGENQRRALDAAISTSLRQAASGQFRSAARVLERLRARRGE